MASAKFRAIIFDIGRVLIRVDISRAMDGLASGLSLTPQVVWSAIEKDPRWLDWQEGRISPRDWHLHLTKRLGASLLSNTDPIHMSHEEARFPFFRFFPIRIYSYRVGASKPDPVIYRQALLACKVRAEEAVYIDDVAAYAETAQRLGMTSIVFQSPEQLQSDLRNLGIQFD